MRDRDPLAWTFALTALFALVAAWNLAMPGKPYFDEVHYVPAARKLLLLIRANMEHPLVGKEAIAAGIALIGDSPWGWRAPSLLFGSLGLFAFGRALWWTSRSAFASLAGMALLATDFAWFIQSRIAMLDMVMAGLAMVALWQLAVAGHDAGSGELPRARSRLALAALAIGLSMGAKWSVVPLFATLGLALLTAQLLRRNTPFPGLGAIELAFWLGTLPLAIYGASFLPAAFYRDYPFALPRIVDWHREMIELQDGVVTRHPYQSVWYQWLVNWRAIWYLYEPLDAAQRGIVLIGNPLTMLLGLPALLWCLSSGLRQRRPERALLFALYAVSLGFWAVSGKPVQFYYHYLIPGTLLIAALALALDAIWRLRSRLRWAAPLTLWLSCALFAWFYPIISAAPLHQGVRSFEAWMWLNSWR